MHPLYIVLLYGVTTLVTVTVAVQIQVQLCIHPVVDNFELNTGHGGNANMVPVAYGTVNNSGSKLNDASTPNFT